MEIYVIARIFVMPTKTVKTQPLVMSVEVVGIAFEVIASDTFFSYNLTESALVFNAKHHLAVYFLDDSHLQRIYVNGLLIFFDKIRSNRVFLA